MKLFKCLFIVTILFLVSCSNTSSNTYRTTTENNSTENNSYSVNVHCYKSYDIDYFNYSLIEFTYTSEKKEIDEDFYTEVSRQTSGGSISQKVHYDYDNYKTYSDDKLQNEINSLDGYEDVYVYYNSHLKIGYLTEKDPMPIYIVKMSDNEVILGINSNAHLLSEEEIIDNAISIDVLKEAYYHFYLDTKTESADLLKEQVDSLEFELFNGESIQNSVALNDDVIAIYRVGFGIGHK